MERILFNYIDKQALAKARSKMHIQSFLRLENDHESE